MKLRHGRISYFLVLKVSEMKAEYFPPKEDIMLQNEAPADFYILVSGAVVKTELETFNHFSLRHLLFIYFLTAYKFLCRNYWS